MPYRDGKPLADVIPPDRRKHKAIALVVAGFLGGAFLVWMLQPPDTKAQSAMPPQPSDDKPARGAITQREVDAMVTKHHDDLRMTCFLGRSEPDAAKVHLTIDIDKNGAVTRSAYEGSDSRVTTCVDKEIRGWIFPVHDRSATAIDIAISFDRT